MESCKILPFRNNQEDPKLDIKKSTNSYKDKLPDVPGFPVTSDYTKIPNLLLRSSSLSAEARIVLEFLMSHKAGHWSTDPKILNQQVGLSIHKTRKSLKELEDNGHLLMIVCRDSKSKMIGSFLAWAVEPFEFNLQDCVKSLESIGCRVTLHPKTIERLKKSQKLQKLYAEKLYKAFSYKAEAENSFNFNVLAGLLRPIKKTNIKNDNKVNCFDTKVSKTIYLAPKAHSISFEDSIKDLPPYQSQQGALPMKETFSRIKANSPTAASIPKPKDTSIEANSQTGPIIESAEAEAVIVTKQGVALPARQRPKINMSIMPDRSANEIITYWNNSGLPEVTKNFYPATIKMLNSIMAGRFFCNYTDYKDTKYGKRAFTKEEIINEIKNRSLSIDDDYMPTDIKTKKVIKNTPINLWFYNKTKNNGKHRSQFIQWFGKKTQPVSGICKVEDMAPDYTKELKKLFEIRVTSDKPVDGKWGTVNEGKFRKAAIRTKEYFEARKLRISSWCNNTPEEQCRWIFEAIKVDVGDDYDGVSPGWLGSDETFEVRLPRYLYKQSILLEEKKVSRAIYIPESIYNRNRTPDQEFYEEKDGCQV